jgi:hypothetical protein
MRGFNYNRRKHKACDCYLQYSIADQGNLTDYPGWAVHRMKALQPNDSKRRLG